MINHDTKFQVAGFHVWWDTEIQGVDKKSVKNGWHIQVQVDPRWTFDDDTGEYFVASIVSDDTILVGVPAVSYDHLYNINGFQNSECVDKEMDEYRNAILPKLTRYRVLPMMWYLLQFPPRPGMTGVRLSTREIYTNIDNVQDDTTLDLKYYPNVSSHHITGQMVTWWAAWNVVAHDTGEKDMADRKRGAPDMNPKKSKAAQQASAFASQLYGTGASTSQHYTSPLPDSAMS